MEPAIIDRGGGPEIAGTRITVYDILHYLDAGRSPAAIAVTLGLSLEQVLAAVEYIKEHQAEVIAVHQRIEERIAQGNPPEVEAKSQASHAKLLARLQQQAANREANGAGNPGGR